MRLGQRLGITAGVPQRTVRRVAAMAPVAAESSGV
jgi:hypothetical protein